MARIRTIKPEFWTDEKIVTLPFEARLLFIGLWNFCDDTGAIHYSPDRIRMQVFPGDHAMDVGGLLDLLGIVGLLDRWESTDDGESFLTIKHWERHQKIDNPGRKTISREGYRKLSIPWKTRQDVATKYGCEPGGQAEAHCYYCGSTGLIHWWTRGDGKPSMWVTLSELEFDHFVSEHTGGDNGPGNMVLACRACNRAKREFDAKEFFEKKNPSIALASPREPSSADLDQGRDQGPRTKERTKPSPAAPVVCPSDVPQDLWDAYMAVRKAKRAPMTTYAMKGLMREAKACGLTLEAAITVCAERNWLTVKPGWLEANPLKKPSFAKKESAHVPNMPLGAPSCECDECNAYRAKRSDEVK